MLCRSAFAFTLEEVERLKLADLNTYVGRIAVLESQGSTIVAAGSSGLIATSLDDGITWTTIGPLFAETQNGPRKISPLSGGSSPTAFFIAGMNGSLRSTNGIDWDVIDTGFISSDIAYKDGVFLSANTARRTNRSTDDGLTWTQRDDADTPERTSNLAVFDDHFYAVGTTEVARSVDGISWINLPLPDLSNRELETLSVAGGELFIAGRNGLILRSSDGLNFTIQESPQTGNLEGNFYQRSDDSYLFINQSRNSLLSFSSDFTTLTALNVPQIGASVLSESGTVIFSDFGKIGRIPLDEDTPTFLPENEPLASAERIIFGNGRFVLVTETEIFSSYNGIDWAPWTLETPSMTSLEEDSLAFGNGIFTVFSSDTNAVFVSEDGSNWERQAVSFRPDIVQFLNDQFIASRNASYWTSMDGRQWNLVDETASERPKRGNRLIYGQGLYLRINISERLQTSSDLATWTTVDDSNISGVDFVNTLFDDGRFIAIAKVNRLWTSTDASSWEQVDTTFPSPVLDQVALRNPEFGVFSFKNGILTRLDVAGDGSLSILSILDATNQGLLSGFDGYAEGNGVLFFYGINVFRSLPEEGSYDFWAGQEFPPELTLADRLPMADFDSDGRNNLLEYAQGSNPVLADGNQTKIIFDLDNSDDLLSATLTTVLPPDRGDVEIFGERSLDLTPNSWNDSGISTFNSPSDSSEAGVIISNVSSDREFYRLRYQLSNTTDLAREGNFGPE